MPNWVQCAYQGGIYNYADGRIYLSPRNASQAARFDPVTQTWETFGDKFPVTNFLHNDKWGYPAVSNFDNCIYALPNFAEGDDEEYKKKQQGFAD